MKVTSAIKCSGVGVLMGAVSLTGYAGSVDSIPPQPVDASTFSKYEKAAGSCQQYIERAAWKYRDNQYSLEITPTTCGRQITDQDTAHFFDELVRDYADPVYWKNTHGLRHQLICHFIIARNKPTWNIEPWRPDVGLDKTIEGSAEFGGGCNPADPLPYDTP
ncbi:DUF2599 domain-containing protein [Pseudomonas alkylphenolica]|jgi:hypothetical protein|uniref:DUF2599 domain-containing protein n=1 Tax=Pseudomonas alkylphenolica TaxID=237609 RepID=A0A6I6GPH1_9PSED|nr:DUF2599 domain-containing protein [Pseudomonas alkylphenolica]QGW76230.1 DUF2599 domain-containing protein [Pseudomonas alkylphenolica]